MEPDRLDAHDVPGRELVGFLRLRPAGPAPKHLAADRQGVQQQDLRHARDGDVGPDVLAGVLLEGGMPAGRG